MAYQKNRKRTEFKVINTYLDLPSEEKQAVWEHKRGEVTRILARHYDAGTLYKN